MKDVSSGTAVITPLVPGCIVGSGSLKGSVIHVPPSFFSVYEELLQSCGSRGSVLKEGLNAGPAALAATLVIVR